MPNNAPLAVLKSLNHSLSCLDICVLAASSRYVIECPNCAVIYRSRQYWYGNQDPVDTVVRTEIQHIWPGVRRTHPDYVDVLPDLKLEESMLMFTVGARSYSPN